MNRIIQAIIIALFFSTASFSGDTGGREDSLLMFPLDDDDEGLTPRTLSTALQQTLAPIGEIDTAELTLILTTCTRSRKGALCDKIIHQINALKNKHCFIIKILEGVQISTSEPITGVSEIIDALTIIQETDLSGFQSLSNKLTSLKDDARSLLGNLKELLDIPYPLARVRTHSDPIVVPPPSQPGTPSNTRIYHTPTPTPTSPTYPFS